MLCRASLVGSLLATCLLACDGASGRRPGESRKADFQRQFPEYAEAYERQQREVVTLAVALSAYDTTVTAQVICPLWSDSSLVVIPSLLDLCSQNPPPLLVTIGDCWRRFLRCENAEQPADCDAEWTRCRSGR